MSSGNYQYQNYANQAQIVSTNEIIKNYKLLSSQDQDQKQSANRFLLTLIDHQETWLTSQAMIQSDQDPSFTYLGAQLLYQKIQKDLHQLNVLIKQQLKVFLFQQIDSSKFQNKIFIVDKLASSIALISCSLILQEWPNFLEDLTQFMKKSNFHLLSGLIILQRIPQQLKMTNRLSQSIKSQIQSKFLQKEELLSSIFDAVFDLQNQKLIQRSLKTMQNWIKIGLSLMKHPSVLTKVLKTSLESFQKLQIGIKVVCQGLKMTSQKNMSSLDGELDLIKQQQKYQQCQIRSLKTVVQFVLSNRKNFLSTNVQIEYLQIYSLTVKQMLLSFGFLILEQIGFQLISIIMEITNSKDLKLSYSTFQFWIDYSQKFTRLRLAQLGSLGINIQNRVYQIYVSLFQLFSNHKLIITNQNLLYEPDLKDDQTVDDADGMTFTQYRKQASSLLKYIYEFFVKVKGQLGAEFYFKKVCQLLQSDNPPLNIKTQLALFILKSPLQSMIKPYQTNHLMSILQYILKKINNHNIITSGIPPIVLGQTMNFIRDCTREIKEKDYLFLQALKFVLNYVNDQKLCHHAAYCFQILMETISVLNDSNIASSLISFYQQKKFTKQVVLQKMLQGIFNAIIKIADLTKVSNYLDIILLTLINKYQLSSKCLQSEAENRSDLYLSLVEIKTVLDSYDGSNVEFKNVYKNKFYELANRSLQIVNQILPLSINKQLRFSSVNQIGLSISIFRICMKTLEFPQNFIMVMDNQYQKPMPIFIPTMGIIFMILNDKDIQQYYYVLTIVSQTLIQFINHQSVQLNLWLMTYLHEFYRFFFQYYKKIQKIDTDVIKMFFTVNQSLILYNPDILNQYQQKFSILNMSLYSIRHLNQRNMQRKVISFIKLSLQNQIYDNNSNQTYNNLNQTYNNNLNQTYDNGLYGTILQNIFCSIPIINSMCYSNLSKIIKHLFQNTTLQQKQILLNNLLKLNPFQNTDQKLKNLLAKTIAISIQLGQERHIKIMFVQITQMVWKRLSHDIFMQLELKLATWQRQLKKSMQQNKLLTQ